MSKEPRLHKIELTPLAFEIAAAALAETVIGGKWLVDYTEEQKEQWRERVKRALA